jgi:hypothetical protein
MLVVIFVLLLMEWVLGVMSSHTLGGLIDVLLALALVVILIGIREGRRGPALYARSRDRGHLTR